VDCFSAIEDAPKHRRLNRYYGVMENGKLKVRGIEVRKRDTPRFVYDGQMEMINVFSAADNSREFMPKDSRCT